MHLKPFGEEPTDGVDLDWIIGRLWGLAQEEEGKGFSPKGPKQKRLNLVNDALALLDEASQMGQGHD